MNSSSTYRLPAGLRVLVIEDHPDGRETLRLLLELLGCRVEVAADGLQGFTMALTRPPDVILSDIGLPRLDGYQVARRIRAYFGLNIYLVAQTGYGQPEDRQRAIEAGFDVHLVKPIDLDELYYHLATAARRVGLSDSWSSASERLADPGRPERRAPNSIA